MSRVIALQAYVGKPVRDADGKKLGHLHDVRARRAGDNLVVHAYVVGSAGLVERFSLAQLAREVAMIFGIGRAPGYLVPWDAMEFTDDGPRCTRRGAELERLSAAPREAR